MEVQGDNRNENVYIIDNAFYIPQLKRYRRIWLYLPPEYYTTKKRFPVLYMHDGQNLFDDAAAFSEEWCVDETINAAKDKCIVVGIDNSAAHRINEYSFHDNQHGRGEGRQYLEFIVHTLKPYIDSTYRTLKEPAFTGIAGSSMGGLISFYAGLYFPQVFGILGVLSPSFWLVPHVFDETKHLLEKNNNVVQRYFFYAGGQEGENMDKHVRSMVKILKGYSNMKVKQILNPGGTHSEGHWREHFPVFFQWMMSGMKARKL